jgi:DNA topoisomerase-1
MEYTLILTEKPSAAKMIAYSLAEGKPKMVKKRRAFWFELKRNGKDIRVVPAVGHLFILAQEEESHHWTYPVFSVKWKPTFLNKNNKWATKYYENIKDLVKNANEFISATDYDIEGSVISYNIFRFIFNVKDGKRMKFSTLTTPDLIYAYEHASPNLDFLRIEAGLTRHQLDWYFGINLTRALTMALESVGGYWTLSTGRVQGPTLSILEKRQKEIEAFKPTPFWELELQGLINNHKITALHVKDKFWKKDEVSGILEKCKGKPAIVKDVEKKEHKQFPPFPFDLTSLQREAYRLFSYSPKMTLDVAQTLYGQALISYPRTSSQKLPAKIGYKTILTKLSEQSEYSELCKKLLEKKSLKPNEGKKTDPAHPAIFPTGNKPKKLNSYQKRVYDLIVKRFFSVFADPAIREQTKIVIDIENEDFVAHGIRTMTPNWFEFYKPYARFKEEILPEVKKGDGVDIKKLSMLEKETEPPNRYSQASILKEMENLGLGTKGTRAHILQTLYDRGYIKERSILVTELGEAVVASLEKYCSEIVSVDLTRKFDEEMAAIEAGKRKREEIVQNAEEELKKILQGFKENQKGIGEGILKAVKEFEHEEHLIGKCNKCGNELRIIHSKRTGKRFVGCSGYPKCTNSFPLPQHGKLQVLSKTCKDCGLRMVSVKTYKKRPWRFCAKCGFEKYKKELEEKKNKTAEKAKEQK